MRYLVLENGVYKKNILKNDIIKGMVLIGDASSNNAISGLIRKGINAAPFKSILMDKDFSMKYKTMAK